MTAAISPGDRCNSMTYSMMARGELASLVVPLSASPLDAVFPVQPYKPWTVISFQALIMIIHRSVDKRNG
jgi:hypothetical protein